MSSISAVGSQFTSPLQRMQSELSAEVSAGTIQSSDQSALSTALTDIDKAMQSQRQSDQASGIRPSPSEMNSKLQDLISSEVQNGTITSDQATELTNLFAKAMPGPGGHGGHGGPHGAGGPGGAVGAAGASAASDPDGDGDNDAAPSAGTSSSGSDVDTLLADFLKSVQDSLNQSSASYDANGQSTTVSAALVIDYQS